MVAHSATAWGASIEESGKIVWFEPATDFRESADIEWVIDQDTAVGIESPSEAAISVCFLGFDLPLYAALNQQYGELRRELRLLALAHEDEYPLASDLSAMFATFDRLFPQTYRDQIDCATAQGQTTVDLDVPMMPAASAIFVTMHEIFDLADAFCHAQRLLSLERTPRQREFHSWLLGEVVRQIDGEEPRRWPGSDTSASRSSNVS